MVGMRGRVLARVAAATVTAALLAQALGVAGASAAQRSDRAAADAYLAATAGLDEALLANMPASTAAGEALASRLLGECPGVLAHLPEAATGTQTAGGGGSARHSGEVARIYMQVTELRFELAETLLSAVFAPDGKALAAYAQKVKGLRWSSRSLAGAVAGASALVEEELGGSAHDVCGDLRFWVTGGLRTLSPGSVQAGAQLTRLIGRSLGDAAGTSAASLRALLDRAAGPGGHSLSARISQLNYRLSSLPSHGAQLKRLQRALGFPSEALEGSEEETQPGTPLGGGTTLSGGFYVVREEHNPGSHGKGCTSVEYGPPSDVAAALDSTSVTAGASCALPRAARRAPTVSCDTGAVTVEATLPPAARRVRLGLSDGRSFTSPTVHIPARLGGPSAFYYEVFAGEPPAAVSLTELGAHGRPLRTLRPGHPPPCERSASEAVSSALVAHGLAPGGSPFSISAYRYGSERGPVHLRADFGSSSAFEELSQEGPLKELAAGPVTVTLAAACGPPVEWLVYGLLKAPGDAVFAQTAGGEVPLGSAAIPARLRPGGRIAVYGVFAGAPPSGLLVRAPGGAPLARLDLSARSAEAAEFCAGYDGG